MTMHIPGSTGERAANAADDMLQAAFAEARQKFGDDPAQSDMFIKLAFGWQYYLESNEVMSVETLVQDYEVLRAAPPNDIAELQTQLARFSS